MDRADLDHEIPNGSRLYFGELAKTKREFESFAASVFVKYGFDEIVTPYFSYHQHLSVPNEQILKFQDKINHTISLRADSTVDVVRIILRRIKDKNLNKIFYIQPVFKYPSLEFYQIGAEMIGKRDLKLALEICSIVLDHFKINSTLQISNIEIPRIICKLLNIEIEEFEKGNGTLFLGSDKKWLRELSRITSLSDLKNIKNNIPNELKDPLEKMEDLSCNSTHKNIKLAPLYYSKMRYYDSLFFRFLGENSIFCSGGDYEIDSLKSSGFAIMSDQVIQNLSKKD